MFSRLNIIQRFTIYTFLHFLRVDLESLYPTILLALFSTFFNVYLNLFCKIFRKNVHQFSHKLNAVGLLNK